MSRLFSLSEQKFSEVREMRILVDGVWRWNFSLCRQFFEWESTVLESLMGVLERFTGASGEDGLGVEGRKVEVLFRLSWHTLGKCF
jgi:hypothetical protein